MEIQKFCLTAHLDYTADSMDRFIELCVQAIASLTDNRQARFLLRTAVDELTLNAIEHGYGGNPGTVSVKMERLPTGIRFEISDTGKGIDPGKLHLDRMARTEADLHSRDWAYSILDKLSEGLEIKSNHPHGARISLVVPIHACEAGEG